MNGECERTILVPEPRQNGVGSRATSSKSSMSRSTMTGTPESPLVHLESVGNKLPGTQSKLCTSKTQGVLLPVALRAHTCQVGKLGISSNVL